MPPIELFQGYLLSINVIAAFAFVMDKERAKRNARRISEKTLFGLCLIGGSVGAYLAMQAVRHKTQKPLFKFGVPIVMVIEIALGALFL